MDFYDIPVKRLDDPHTYQEFNATIEEIKKKAYASDLLEFIGLTDDNFDLVAQQLALKANRDEMLEMLNVKATKAELAAQVSRLDARIDEKADSSSVNSGLSLKVNKTDYDANNNRINGELTRIEDKVNTKVEQVIFNAAMTDILSKLDTKANVTDVNSALNTKADKMELNNQVAILNNSINSKVDQTAFNTEKTRVNTEIARVEAKTDTKIDQAFADGRYSPILKTIIDFNADRQIVLSDRGAILRGSSNTEIKVIVPSEATLNLPIGFQVFVKQQGDGKILVVGQPNVTLQSPEGRVITEFKYSQFWLTKEAQNVWSIYGGLAKDVLATFASRVISDGGTIDRALLSSEYNLLPSLVRNQANLSIIAGANKNGAVYAINPTTGEYIIFSFSRAGIATYFDKEGILRTSTANNIRTDYDPFTKICKGYLIEGSSTNMVRESSVFLNSWSKVFLTVSNNAGISPDGLNSANRLTEDTTNNSRYCSFANVLPTANTTYTASIFVKSGERKHFRLQLQNVAATWGGTSRSAFFNLENGTIYKIENCTAIITKCNDGWYRCSVTSTTGATVSTSGFNIIMLNSQTEDVTYLGDGVSGMFAWGGQFEPLANMSSYIQTGGTQITRIADAMVSSSSEWINTLECTIHSKLVALPMPGVAGAAAIVEVGDSTANNRIANRFILSNGAPNGIIVAEGNNLMSETMASGNYSFSSAIAAKANDFIFSSRGSLSPALSSGAMPKCTRMQVGSGSNSGFMYSTFNSISYIPKRLTNAELQTITT